MAKIFKKYLAMFLAFIILVSVFTGCTGNTKKADGEPAAGATNGKVPDGKPATWISDTMKVTMLFFDDAKMPFNPNWPQAKYAKEKTGVTIEFIPVSNADFTTKSKIIMSSGEAPDIVTRADYLFYDYFNDGAWIPVSDYFSKMPNFKRAAQIAGAEKAIEEFKEADGKFYNLPDFRSFTVNNQQLFFRDDIMKKYNLQYPKTLDDMLNVLRTIKSKEPSMKGFGFVDKTETLGGIVGKWFNDVSSFGGALNNDNCFDFNDQTKKWEFGPTSEKSRGALTFLNTLYKEGLMDTECFTMPREQMRTRLTNGAYSAVTSYYSDTEIALAAGAKTFGPDFKYKYAFPPETKFGRSYTTGADGKWQYMTCITSQAKKRHEKEMDQFMTFVDWFRYSEDMWNMNNFGVLGESYDMVDGKPKLRPEYKSIDNPKGTIEMDKTYGAGLVPFRGYLKPELEMRELPTDYRQFQIDTVKLGYCKPARKKIVFKVQDQDIINQYAPSLKTYVNEMATKFIMGTLPLDDKNWEDYKKSCEQRGYKKMEEVYNKPAAK